VKKGNLKKGYCWATKGKRSIDRTRNELHGRESDTPHLTSPLPLPLPQTTHYLVAFALSKSLKYGKFYGTSYNF
jgi:hypothetical protein